MIVYNSERKVLVFILAVTVAFTTLAHLGCQNSRIKLQIAADVNRDGQVEFDADESGKNMWADTRGAIFFNNNDSDQDSKEPDYADSVVNGRNDLEDLAVLKIKRLPKLPEGARVSISVDEPSLSRVNLFQKIGENEYKNVDLSAEGNIDPALLMKEDLELRIEANSYADGSWNGVAYDGIVDYVLPPWVVEYWTQ